VYYKLLSLLLLGDFCGLRGQKNIVDKLDFYNYKHFKLMINKQMIIALVIHSVMALSVLFDPEYGFISYFVAAAVVLNLIGMAIIKSGKKKEGAWVFLISSALLVPIGLIGAFGAHKIIDEEKKQKFYNSLND